jgi:hypothetical protein
MKNVTYAALILALLPMSGLAAQAKSMHPSLHKAASKKAAPTMYECTKCHMIVTAAVAKKDHYHDAMDGGTYVPVKK